MDEMQLEKLRGRAKTLTYICCVLSVISLPFLCYVFYLSLQDSGDAFWLILVKSIVVGIVCALGVLVFLWWILVKGTYHKFDENFRNKYVISLISNVPGFTKLQYHQKDGFLWEEIQESGVVNCGNRKYYQKEDLLLGQYQGIYFKLSDVTTQKPKVSDKHNKVEEIFSGQVMCVYQFDDRKASKGHIQIFQKEFFSDIRGWKAEHKIETENEAFQKRFYVYADDPHNAYYILTPQKMEKIMEFVDAVGVQVAMSFYDERLYIAVKRRSMFNAVIDEPVSEQKERILEDISILQKAFALLVSVS